VFLRAAIKAERRAGDDALIRHWIARNSNSKQIRELTGR